MTVHKCLKLADIAILNEKMTKIEKLMYGNGSPGFQTQMVRLNANMEERMKIDNDIKTALNGLLRFQTEMQTINNRRDRRETIRLTIIGLIFAGVSIIVTLYLSK